MLLIDLRFFVLLCVCLFVCFFVLLCICFSVCLFVCRCNNQTHTRVLNLRHVESKFSFFLFTFFLFSCTFFLDFAAFLFAAALHNFCRLISFSLVIASSPLSFSLSFTQCLSCCAFHLAIFILGHCRQANIVFCQSHFSADIFIPKQKSPFPPHLVPSLTAPHYTVE